MTAMNRNPGDGTIKRLAFDVGLSRVGVARSTALGRGEPVATLRSKERPWSALMPEIEGLVREFEIEGFVVGLPLNMDGSTGPQARCSESFAEALREAFPDVPVAMEDERLTSAEALERLHEIGVSGKKAREKIDAAAACLIVEAHLERRKAEG